jgi:hypothetical protein
VHEDFDDTVLIPSLRQRQPESEVDEDTVVPHEPNDHESTAPLRPPAPRTAAASVVSTVAARRPSPVVAGDHHPPALVEPPQHRPRRVPLTHKRLQESLRDPAIARDAAVLPESPVHAPGPVRAPSPASSALPSPAAMASAAAALARTPEPLSVPPRTPAFVDGFRMAGRPAVDLDVPALIGRKPTAPRVIGKAFPRLVRVPSPLNEVSSTHIELRQEGKSVIVTDLRSTNGTVVRMPGARPVKLRQGESLVVRPGTLIDIGDGNVFEILAPPRLGVAGGSAGAGTRA